MLSVSCYKIFSEFLLNYSELLFNNYYFLRNVHEGRPRGELQQADAEHDQPLDPQPGRGRHPLHRLLRPLLRGGICPPSQLALRRRLVSYRNVTQMTSRSLGGKGSRIL